MQRGGPNGQRFPQNGASFENMREAGIRRHAGWAPPDQPRQKFVRNDASGPPTRSPYLPSSTSNSDVFPNRAIFSPTERDRQYVPTARASETWRTATEPLRPNRVSESPTFKWDQRTSTS
ncbi:hypothetical protein OSTOST_17341, partial [Ostertagia ostertagi]